MNKIYYTRHDDSLTLYKDGKLATVSTTNPAFEAIMVALRARQYDKVLELIEGPGERINKVGASKDRKLAGRKVFVKSGVVYWINSHQKPVQLDEGPLVDRILESLAEGNTNFADALLRFLDNVQKNVIKDIRNELYLFLKNGKMPITEDGCFLAYKKVRDNYMDVHSGTFDNSAGKVVRMAQKDVNPDRNQLCSTGLHFGARGYMNQFGGERCMIVKVNPRHVFAIPADYNNMKGRASEYFVCGEYTAYSKSNDHEAFKTAFIDDDTKQTAAPGVKFSGWLKPSLENVGASYGMVKDGKVTLVERRGMDIAVKTVITLDGAEYYDVQGVEVKGEARTLSITTKSAREALKRAINWLER